jgi:hypothetical protein
VGLEGCANCGGSVAESAGGEAIEKTGFANFGVTDEDDFLRSWDFLWAGRSEEACGNLDWERGKRGGLWEEVERKGGGEDGGLCVAGRGSGRFACEGPTKSNKGPNPRVDWVE